MNTLTLTELQRPSMSFLITEIVNRQAGNYNVLTTLGPLTIIVNEYAQVMGWKPWNLN